MKGNKKPSEVGLEVRVDASGHRRWRAVVYDKTIGKNRVGSWTRSKQQAKGERVDLLAQLRAGAPSRRRGEPLTTAMRRFLDGMRTGAIRNRSGRPFKPSVCRSYESAFRLYFEPALGARPFDLVRRRDVQAVVDAVAVSHSASTARNAVMPIRAFYRWAMTRELVEVNPTALIEVPVSTGRRDRIATAPEAFQLLRVLPPHDAGIWASFFFGGLRLGEAQALRYEDLDFDSHEIQVVYSWDPKAGLVAPKSDAGRRLVPMPKVLRGPLAEVAGNSRWRKGLLFGRSPEIAFSASALTGRADRLWASAGLPRVTPHEARHTFASLMIEAMKRDHTLNVKVLSEIMGHSSITVTYDRYGHLLPGSERRAAAALDAYLEALPNGVPTEPTRSEKPRQEADS